MKKKSRIIATSIATVAMCASLIAGGTYALFTSESTVNVAVTSGTVSVVATASEPKLSSSLGKNATGTSATMNDNTITISNMVPGDQVDFTITVSNESTVSVLYRTLVKVVEDDGLFEGLVVSIDEAEFNGMTAVADWNELAVGSADEVVNVSVSLPDSHKGVATFGEDNLDNKYQGKTCTLAYTVEAVQGNADMSGYENTVELYTKQDLFGFARQVNADGDFYANKTVKLMNDIDLNNEAWQPIGANTMASYPGTAFKGTFDGNGKTISNLNVSSDEPDYATAGLFGALQGGTTISNVTLENVTVNSTKYAGGIAAYWSEGGVTIKNCHVIGGSITSVMELTSDGWDNGDKVGGVIGYGVGGKIEDCSAEDLNITATRDLGGIIGVGNGVTMTRCNVENVAITYSMTRSYVTAGVFACNYHDYNADVNAWTAVDCTSENVTIKQVITSFEDLKAALNKGEKTLYLSGEITLTESLSANDVTFIGADENAAINFNGYNITGDGASTVTYKNLKLTTISLPYGGAGVGERYGWYGGIDYVRHTEANYENCTISTVFTLYSDTVNIKDCTFLPYVQDGEEFYHIFVYSADTVNVTGSTFYYGDRAIKIYTEGSSHAPTVNISGCKFKADKMTKLNKALINIDAYNGPVVLSYSDLTIDDELATLDIYSITNSQSVTVNGVKVQ